MHTLGITQRVSRPALGLQAILGIGWAAFSVLFGGAVGGIVGEPCKYCSADVDRLFWGAVTAAVLLMAVAVVAGRQKRWATVAALVVALLPAMYYSASLAQTVGLWWDRL